MHSMVSTLPMSIDRIDIGSRSYDSALKVTGRPSPTVPIPIPIPSTEF